MDETTPLLKRLESLNEVDLSVLKNRIEEARKALQDALQQRAQIEHHIQNAPAKSDGKTTSGASGTSGGSLDELLDALEAAKRMGLI